MGLIRGEIYIRRPDRPVNYVSGLYCKIPDNLGTLQDLIDETEEHDGEA